MWQRWWWWCSCYSGDSCLYSYWRRISTLYWSSTSIACFRLMCCLLASACWATACLLMMTSCSWQSFSISYWTLASSSSSTASSLRTSSSQSSTWICSSWILPWMTCISEGAHWGDWCRGPPLVWVELLPQPFCLKPTVMVDMLLAGWCSCTSGMSPKAKFSRPLAMVERVWVGGWFWVEVGGKSSSGCRP
jgi:hypothetical protein